MSACPRGGMGARGWCRRTPLACCLALLLLPLLAACGEVVRTPGADVMPSRSPVGVSTLARSPVVPGSPSQATSVQPTVTPATPALPGPTATMATGAADPCDAVAGGSGNRLVVSNASVAAASRISLLYFRGRTYVGNGDPSYGPDGTRLATPRYVVDRPIGKTFSRWQSGGQFPAGSAVYSVAGEPVERLVAVKGPDWTWLFRHYPDDRLYSLDTLQIVMGTVKCFGPGRWTTPDGKLPTPGSRARPEDYLFYTPATIAVERVLHGRIPADEREIEVWQLGSVNGETPRLNVRSSADSPPVPLTPGSQVILFVRPGQWSRGGPGSMPPGNYY